MSDRAPRLRLPGMRTMKVAGRRAARSSATHRHDGGAIGWLVFGGPWLPAPRPERTPVRDPKLTGGPDAENQSVLVVRSPGRRGGKFLRLGFQELEDQQRRPLRRGRARPQRKRDDR